MNIFCHYPANAYKMQTIKQNELYAFLFHCVFFLNLRRPFLINVIISLSLHHQDMHAQQLAMHLCFLSYDVVSENVIISCIENDNPLVD